MWLLPESRSRVHCLAVQGRCCALGLGSAALEFEIVVFLPPTLG